MLAHALQVYYTVAVCVLFASGSDSQRVYFECGAKVSTVDSQGLVLSPGFPNNYSSGTHCVWQFFVTAGHRLSMEMFDFDVYESPSGSGGELDEGLRDDAEGLARIGIEEPRKTEQKQVVIQDANSILLSSLWDKTNNSLPRGTQQTEDETPDPRAAMDACPQDVLYITDLITVSSRFCGSKRPSESQLVFGSDAEITEVIMELITSTPWGRGFALIFRYSNKTQTGAGVGEQRSLVPSGGAVVALLAAVSIAALFAVALIVVLCLILRNKLCAKSSNPASSISSEVPVQIPHAEGLLVHDVCEISQNAELECSNGLLEMELGTDEVFVISNTTSYFSTPESFLQLGDVRAAQPSDWMPGSDPSGAGHVGSARPRAWSVRTFQDFLPPLPQLHKKWCSWNLSSPFSKLLDPVSPCPATDGSDVRNLSGSWTSLPPAQRQRRFNPLRFNPSTSAPHRPFDPDGAPCGQGKVCDYLADDGNDSVPIFAISEEDDREPLVSSDRQTRASLADGKNSVLGSAHSAVMKEEGSKSGVWENPVSHVTVPCDLVGKDHVTKG